MKLTHTQVGYLTVAVVILIFYSPSAADIYKYIDDNGNARFTDDPGDKAQIVSRDAQDSNSLTETSFKLVDNHIVVPVTVSYKGREVKGQFVFDTGAATSLISPNIARQLEINSRYDHHSWIQGVGGITLAGSVVLDSISIGPRRVSSVKVPVTSVGSYDGLLGNDLLKSSRFQIDYEDRLIRWQ